MFSTLSWFQNLEDRERGDEFEGTHKYFPVGGLEITRTERDGRPHPPVTFTYPNQSLQSKATGSDHIFIYSTSLRPGLTQFGNAAVPTACVEIYDPAKFVLRLRAVLRRTPRAKVETLIHDEVRYYSFADPPGNVYALPDRLTMHKHDGFGNQHEYRIAFGTKRDVLTSSTSSTRWWGIASGNRDTLLRILIIAGSCASVRCTTAPACCERMLHCCAARRRPAQRVSTNA
jgi:hypothetical protein